uniref:proton-coupled zinc antiporter SLC30A2-like n=1 Tax=Doryrhamphus excisus TaxID=161450 RepID=UPI0025AE59F9|nr:proton-coupled zinc antiporter SLC30A2-like [Doryrhamphus excisus]
MEPSAESEKPLLECQGRPSCARDQRASHSDAPLPDHLQQLERSCGGELGVTSPNESQARCAARRKLLVALAISLIFMVGEVLGGYAAHSLAIMTDAAHLLTDVGSIAVSIFSLWVSGRPPTPTMTFGWHRAEVLGMLLSLMSIWTVTAVLVLSAVQRITDGGGGDGGYHIDADVMLLTSGCAVAVNILMVVILHQSGVSHSHAFSAAHGNASVKAAFIHAVGDLVQSVGVLLTAAVIRLWPECQAADPVCTLLFSVLVMWSTLPAARDVFRVLMDGAPPNVCYASVRDVLLSVPGVASLHNLHVWSLDTTHCLLCVHVTAEDDADPLVVLATATELLRSEFGFTGMTLQVEQSGTTKTDW